MAQLRFYPCFRVDMWPKFAKQSTEFRHDDWHETNTCPISPSEHLLLPTLSQWCSFGQQNANRFKEESWIYREKYNLIPAELQSGRTETWECLAPFCDTGLQNEANKEGTAEKERDQVLMSFKASDQTLLDSSGLLSYLSPYILFPLASLSKVCFFFNHLHPKRLIQIGSLRE